MLSRPFAHSLAYGSLNYGAATAESRPVMGSQLLLLLHHPKASLGAGALRAERRLTPEGTRYREPKWGRGRESAGTQGWVSQK